MTEVTNTFNDASNPVSAEFKKRCEDFINACQHGTASDLQKFLDEGIPVNADSYGFSALQIAAINLNEEAAVFLLEKGANVNMRTRNCPYSPLYLAVSTCVGDYNPLASSLKKPPTPEIVRLFLDHGAAVGPLKVQEHASTCAYSEALKNIHRANAPIIKEMLENAHRDRIARAIARREARRQERIAEAQKAHILKSPLALSRKLRLNSSL